MKRSSLAAAHILHLARGDETEQRRSIMRRWAASMASRAASRAFSRWPHRRYRCGFFPGRASRKCPAHSLARLDCRSCGAAGWAETRTPLRHRRDTSQIPAAARAPHSRAASLKPPETASPPRAHPPASARGQTIRALPWEDATARFLQLGFEVARRPVRARELFLIRQRSAI